MYFHGPTVVGLTKYPYYMHGDFTLQYIDKEEYGGGYPTYRSTTYRLIILVRRVRDPIILKSFAQG
jgi:hypothetical protein